MAWNSAFIAALRAETTPPSLAARNLAILHSAMYDAGKSTRGQDAEEFVASVAAVHRVAVSLYPSRRATFDELLQSQSASVEKNAAVLAALALGEQAAATILKERSNDGSSTTVPYIPSTEPGKWRRTAPYFRPPESPHWALVKPFALESPSQFRPAGPPPLSSTDWVNDFNLTKQLGGKNSAARTPDQTQAARFWSDFSYTSTPPGHWNEIAAVVARQRHLSLMETARLFALLNVALADAGIACWDAKYAYNSWRPVTAIRAAEADGHPETLPDPVWEPLLHTPAHPEYPSGHSTFSGAAAAILIHFFGTDNIAFEIGSDALPGVTRSFQSFSQAAEEIGLSRIHGGIHFPSADRDGRKLGAAIAGQAIKRFSLADEPRTNDSPTSPAGSR
jgi:membrane-associated phospholipid phosphatase